MVKTPQTCSEEWRKRISAFQDGDISSQERRSVEQHLQICESCQHILQSYQSMYAKLNSSPDFEKSIPFSQPLQETVQRHLWSRPLKATSRSFSLGSIAAIVVMIVIVATLVRDQQNRTTLSATFTHRGIAAPVVNTVLTDTSPFSQQMTPNGTPCANEHSNKPLNYIFAGTNGTLWEVAACQNPVSIGAIVPSNFHLGALSPDGMYVTVFTPDLPEYGISPKFSIWDVQQHTFRTTAAMYANDALTLDHVDEAQWVDSTQLLTLSSHTVSSLSLPTMTMIQLPIKNVGHIVVRGTIVYFTSLENNAVTLFSYDLITKNQQTILPLRSNGYMCSDTVGLCQSMTLWDISADGTMLVYQQNQYMPMQIYNIATRTTITHVNLPSQAFSLSKVRFAPDGHAIALLGSDPSIAKYTIGIYAAHDATWQGVITSHVESGYDSFRWRADSMGLIVEPRHQDVALTPFIINITTMKHDMNLQASTSDYVWFGNEN